MTGKKKHNQQRKAKKKEQAAFNKEQSRIVELMKKTVKHDHKKCKCEGCYWWTMTKVIMQNGRFYEVVRSWKDLDRDEWLRISMSYQKYKDDKRMSKEEIEKFLIGKGVPPDKAKQMGIMMSAPTFVVMYKNAPSPMGLLRDI